MVRISIAEGKNPVGESAERQNPVTIGGVDGDNKIVGLVLNADGSITAKLAAGTVIAGKFIPVDADGDEKFTDANPASMKLTGSILAEQLSNTDAVDNVLTFSENITSIEIYHEESTWQSFTVNALTLKIPAGGYRTPIGGTAGATVTIPTGISCIVGRLE